MFIVYIPIGLISLALVPALLPRVPGRRAGVDLLGAAAVTGGLALAVYAIVLAPEHGWTAAATLGELSRLIARFGPRPLIVTGLVVLAAGLGVLSTVHPHGGFVTDVLPGSLISAVGMALVFIPATMAAIGGVAPEQGGPASGIVNTTYQIGSAVGLAVMTAIATSHGAGALGDPQALTHGFQAAFIGAAGVALAGALLGLATLRAPKPVPEPEREAVGA
ncbi:hypothetical protein GCM10023195_74530 [Actinoallomurus liliacearum]|uniref:Major facilitator superfamily (MFS) profile domain-containing protein n=1 Tax=Actinoallomurus liliacearum TaxID=1080073 RepID=A0ABP8TWY2_9ACTN